MNQVKILILFCWFGTLIMKVKLSALHHGITVFNAVWSGFMLYILEMQ